MSGPGVSEAYFAAVSAIAGVLGVTPLPSGISVAETADWTLTVNVSSAPAKSDGSEIDIPPFGVVATHKQFLVIAALNPTGGMIGGGMEEGEFIEQMNVLARARGEQPIPLDTGEIGG